MADRTLDLDQQALDDYGAYAIIFEQTVEMLEEQHTHMLEHHEDGLCATNAKSLLETLVILNGVTLLMAGIVAARLDVPMPQMSIVRPVNPQSGE